MTRQDFSRRSTATELMDTEPTSFEVLVSAAPQPCALRHGVHGFPKRTFRILIHFWS